MKEERYFYVPQCDRLKALPPEESQHAVRVLRLKEGDNIMLMDGEGTFYKAEVTLVANKHCEYNITEEVPQSRQWKGHIHIAMAPTKMMERVEWLAEKATEIGFDELSFLDCKFSERHHLRADRVDKIIIGATKQSRKAWKPQVNELTSFRDFIATERDGLKLICHCYDEVERHDLVNLLQETQHHDAEGKSKQGNDDVTILIGPEGDFSIDEVRLALERGYRSVSLGSSRLRTETAALFAVMAAHISKRN